MKKNNFVQNAICFIDLNYHNGVSLMEVSEFVGFSRYHFHRIFKSYTGYSVKEYVMLKQFHKSLLLLENHYNNILEVSVECGFESQESFTRAFKKYFGITPGKIRKNGPFLKKSLNRLENVIEYAMQKKITGGEIMQPDIINKESFKIIGIRCFSNNKNGEIPRAWDEFNKRYNEIQNRISNYVLGVCEYVENFDHESSDKFEYICCCEVSNADQVPEGMVAKEIPAQKYARFKHMGSTENLGNTYNKIYGEYIPENNLILEPAADFELYGEEFKFDSEDSIMYIYIPVK